MAIEIILLYCNVYTMYDEYIHIYIYIVVFDSEECNVNVIAGCCCLSDWLIVHISSMSLSISPNYKCTYIYIFLE